MKQCKYEKCQKDFEPLKPKAIYCSAKCRVYGNRELNKADATQNKAQEGEGRVNIADSAKKVNKEKSNTVEMGKNGVINAPSISISDLTQATSVIKPFEQPKTNFVINTADKPPIPEKMPGENPFDFAGRKNEWKRLYG